MEISEFIDELIVAMDPPEDIELNADTDLNQVECFDSLAQLGIIVMFDSKFGKTIDADLIFANSIVSSLYKLAVE